MEALDLERSRPTRDVLSITHIGWERVRRIVEDAAEAQANRTPTWDGPRLLVSLILNRSLRTRLGMADACSRLGVDYIDLPPDGIYSPVGGDKLRPYTDESASDFASVINEHADVFALRAYGPGHDIPVGGGDELLRRILERVTKPVLNLETDSSHPVQALADLATIFSYRPDPAIQPRLTIAWAFSPEPKPIAVASSLLLAAVACGLDVTLAAPAEFQLPAHIANRAQTWCRMSGGQLAISEDLDSIRNADFLYMKSWLSTSSEVESHAELASKYRDWCATGQLIARGPSVMRYMHCLPVDRGYEATEEVVNGPNSLIWQQVAMKRVIMRMILGSVLGQ